MSLIEQNKEVARRWVEDFWGGSPTIADEIIADHCIFHTAPELPRGPEGLKLWSESFYAAFTDIQLRAVELIAEDNKVVVRFTGKGMHTEGPFMDYEASGKEVQFVGVDIFYIIGGKISEHWIYFDVLGLG